MMRLHLALLGFLSLLPLARCFYSETGDVCQTAPFFPGYKLAGEGFDVVTLKRKSYLINMTTFMTPNGTCHLFNNPLQNNQVQKLPLSAVSLRAFSHCHSDLQQTAESSVSKVVNALSTQDSPDWKMDLSPDMFTNLELGGTRSDQYKFASTRVKEDKFTFSIHSSSCTHYRYQVSHTSPLSEDFKTDLSLLPSNYNSSTKAEYRRLIHAYGTHYIRQSSLGGKFRRLTAVRTCLASLRGLSASQAHGCLSLGIANALGKLSAPWSNKICTDFLEDSLFPRFRPSAMYLHHTEVVGGNGWSGEFSLPSGDSAGYNTWLHSLKERPDVIQYSLRLISTLVKDPRKKSNVKAAIEDYLKENNMSKQEGIPCDMSCCPTPEESYKGQLSVTVVKAWNLNGDFGGTTDSYVTLWYGDVSRTTRVIESDNPVWNQQFDLGKVRTLGSLEIRVWDDDPIFDTVLIKCERRFLRPEPFLRSGTHTFNCYGEGGQGVMVTYTLTCHQHLAGDHCDDYKARP